MKRLIVCKCVGTHEAWFLAAPVHILDDSPLFLQLQTYFMDGLFFNQKTNNNIQISYSLKYKHSKKEYILYEKIKSKNQSYNVSYALYGNYFCKEKLLLSRSTSAYFPYFRAIPVQSYCTWCQSRYLTSMALLLYTFSLIWIGASKFPNC